MAATAPDLTRRAAIRATRALQTANYWLIAKVTLGLLALLRRLPADSALAFLDRAARRIGPLAGRHRTALANLRAAYPDKTEDELQAIASDMWGNMARLAGEYVFLEKLLEEEDENGLPARVEVVGADIFLDLRDNPAPRILFTAHLGNFELLPIIAAKYGLPVSALYRAPNNPYLAAALMEKREATMGDLIASRPGSVFALARVLEDGGHVGMLVDQKFIDGVPTTFFGRPCQSSPVLARLARQFDCEVHPTRCTRLPGNRFRIEIGEKVVLPRTDKGRIDIEAATQTINDVVEAWVREDPGQWMWFHRRWQIKTHGRKRGR